MTQIDLAHALRMPKGSEELFTLFARFEFALKSSGFLLKSDGDAQANWDQFGNALGRDFFTDIERAGIAKTILTQPPRKQIAVNGVLAWEDMQAAKSAAELFVAVRRVRNNLFHGGKSNDPTSDRNAALVQESKAVLEHALGCHPEVCQAFQGRY